MRTLYVKRVTLHDLQVNNWPNVALDPFQRYYMRCNKKGVINWDKAPLYSGDELIVRNNVKIIS